MKIYDYNNLKKFYACGDLHGEFDSLFYELKNNLLYDKKKFKENKHPLEIEEEKRKKDEQERIEERQILPINTDILDSFFNDSKLNNSLVIFSGDCGFGFNKFQYYVDKLSKINEIITETNTHILFVRGNHDDPSYFSEEKINFSNIKCIPDYSIVKVNDNNILCVGGAISVDRIWRKQQENVINKYSKSKNRKLYWEDECVYLDRNIITFLKNNDITIDGVITHSSPSFAFPSEKTSAIEWFKLDSSLKDDVKRERSILSELYTILIENNHNIKYWVHGHFHLSNFKFKFNTLFIALNCDIKFRNILKLYNDAMDNRENNS